MNFFEKIKTLFLLNDVDKAINSKQSVDHKNNIKPSVEVLHPELKKRLLDNPNEYQKMYDAFESAIEKLIVKDLNDTVFKEATDLLKQLGLFFNYTIEQKQFLYEFVDEEKEKINLNERYAHYRTVIYSGRLNFECDLYLGKIEKVFDNAIYKKTFSTNELEDTLKRFHSYPQKIHSKIVEWDLTNELDISKKFNENTFLEGDLLFIVKYNELKEKANIISNGLINLNEIEKNEAYEIEERRREQRKREVEVEQKKEYNWVCKKCRFTLRQHDMPRNTGTCYSDKHAHYPHNFIKA